MLDSINIFAALRTKTPRELLMDQQSKALVDRIEHIKHAEYHGAMAKMLDTRIQRIEKTLRENPPQTGEGS